MAYKLPIKFDKQQIKQILLLVPLHREGLTSYLSPLLGQYGIRNIDFVNSFIVAFNSSTNSIFEGEISSDDLEAGLSDEILTVPVYLTVYKGGKYAIKTGFSLIGSIYNTTFKKKRRYYRKGNFFRNYKKLLQLAMFSSYVESSMELKLSKYTNCGSKYFQDRYKEVRNSVQRKK